MPSTPWTKNQLAGFHSAAQSLKLYRRAELQSEADGGSLIEALYVDPLPQNHVLQTILKPNTTFLIGRKGTGKSTIFQRAQHELRKQNDRASAYLDIKTIFESSQVDPVLASKMEADPAALPRASLEQLLLYRGFLKEVILKIQEDLRERVEQSLWSKLKESFTGSLDDLFESLTELLEDAERGEFLNVVGLQASSQKDKSEATRENSRDTRLGADIGSDPSIKGSLEAKHVARFSEGNERSYSDLLMLIFNIKEYILRLKGLLQRLSIKHLYVFVDDFSELPEGAMTVVVDSILAPLNNWSDELIKFKVAAYPGRVYYGAIDKTKIDEVTLDIYSQYGTSDVAEMEAKAIEFTKRLVAKRIKYFSKAEYEIFFDIKEEDLWRQLFYATMANPRILGYLLFYLYETNLIYDNPIFVSSVRDAARRYYEEKIEPYFTLNKFLHESFTERSSIFSLKELLESIVERARELRGHRGSAVLRDIGGRPPTSHFHVVKTLEELLSTLELNFFLTKYYEMKRDEPLEEVRGATSTTLMVWRSTSNFSSLCPGAWHLAIVAQRGLELHTEGG